MRKEDITHNCARAKFLGMKVPPPCTCPTLTKLALAPMLACSASANALISRGGPRYCGADNLLPRVRPRSRPHRVRQRCGGHLREPPGEAERWLVNLHSVNDMTDVPPMSNNRWIATTVASAYASASASTPAAAAAAAASQSTTRSARGMRGSR